MAQLAGKRILIVGAETDVGRDDATALAEAGATLALVTSRGDPESAFAVQRLARKLSAATSQAIEATNEAAVRGMVRQVSKAMGGLDAVVICTPDEGERGLVRRYGEKEMGRTGGGVCIAPEEGDDVVAALAALLATG